MFRNDDFIIGSIRAQANILHDVLKNMEEDNLWREHLPFYTKRLQSVEKAINKIRHSELTNVASVFSQ
jgi:hypothetical protein